MRINTVFNKLLSLQGAWVRSVRFGVGEITVVVTRHARRHRCPQCPFSTAAGYDQHVASWRHVALGKWRVIITATVSRMECPTHGVQTEVVPWAQPGSRFTLDFEDLTAWLTREMNITAVTRLIHVTWRTVGRIIARVVGRKIDTKRLDELYVIGLDEVSYRKGHKYLTVVADHRSGDPVWITEGRSQKTLGKFFDELGPERSAKIEFVTMDMCAPFIAEVRERAQNAEIVFDPFHVVKLASEAIHDLRRTEARVRKGSEEAAVLKGSRWALLKAPESLTPTEKLRLYDVAAINQRVYRGYLLKEELRAMYTCKSGTGRVETPRRMAELGESLQATALCEAGAHERRYATIVARPGAAAQRAAAVRGRAALAGEFEIGPTGVAEPDSVGRRLSRTDADLAPAVAQLGLQDEASQALVVLAAEAHELAAELPAARYALDAQDRRCRQKRRGLDAERQLNRLPLVDRDRAEEADPRGAEIAGRAPGLFRQAQIASTSLAAANSTGTLQRMRKASRRCTRRTSPASPTRARCAEAPRLLSNTPPKTRQPSSCPTERRTPTPAGIAADGRVWSKTSSMASAVCSDTIAPTTIDRLPPIGSSTVIRSPTRNLSISIIDSAQRMST